MVTWNTEAFTRARNYVFTNQQNCNDSGYLAPAVKVAHFFQTKYKLGIATPDGLSAHTTDLDRNARHVIEAIHDFCTNFFSNVVTEIAANNVQQREPSIRATIAFDIKKFFIDRFDGKVAAVIDTARLEQWQVNAQLCYALFFAIHIFPKVEDFPKQNGSIPFYSNNIHKNIVFYLKTKLWDTCEKVSGDRVMPKIRGYFKKAIAGLASYSGSFPTRIRSTACQDQNFVKLERPQISLKKRKRKLETEEENATKKIRSIAQNVVPKLCLLTLQPLKKGYNVDHLDCWTDCLQMLKALLKVSSDEGRFTSIECKNPTFTLTGCWENCPSPDGCEEHTKYKVTEESLDNVAFYFFCNICNLILSNSDANSEKDSKSLFEYFEKKALYYLLAEKFKDNTNCFTSIMEGEKNVLIAEYYRKWVHYNTLFYKCSMDINDSEDNNLVPQFAKILSQLRQNNKDVYLDILPKPDDIDAWNRDYQRICLDEDQMCWKQTDVFFDLDETRVLQRVSAKLAEYVNHTVDPEVKRNQRSFR